METKFSYCQIGLGPTATRLTGREKATVLFLALGMSNKEIAQRTKRSPASVKKTVDSLFGAFGVSTRGAVIAQAFCHRVAVPAVGVRG